MDDVRSPTARAWPASGPVPVSGFVVDGATLLSGGWLSIDHNVLCDFAPRSQEGTARRMVGRDALCYLQEQLHGSCNGGAFPPASGAQHENDDHSIAHDGAPNDAVSPNGSDVASVWWW